MSQKNDLTAGQALTALLNACEDVAEDSSAQREIRVLKRSLDGRSISLPEQEALRQILTDLRIALRERQTHMALICLSRAQDLIGQLSESGKRRKRMGLFDKIKKSLGDRDRRTQDRQLADKKRQVSSDIYELKQKIADLQERKYRLECKYREAAAECAKIGKSDPRYVSIRREALTLQPQIQALDRSIAAYDKALQNNAQYQAMIESGEMIRELAGLQPDVAEVDAILGTITEQTEDMTGNIDDMSDTIRAYDRNLASAVPSATGEPDPFDQLISELSPTAAEAPVQSVKGSVRQTPVRSPTSVGSPAAATGSSETQMPARRSAAEGRPRTEKPAASEVPDTQEECN